MPTGSHPLPGPLSRAVADLLSSHINGHPHPQRVIAEAANISASQLSRLLSGQKVFTLDQLDATCQALGIQITDLIGHADQLTRDRVAPANVIEIRRRVDAELSGENSEPSSRAARKRNTEPTEEQ